MRLMMGLFSRLASLVFYLALITSANTGMLYTVHTHTYAHLYFECFDDVGLPRVGAPGLEKTRFLRKRFEVFRCFRFL